MPLLHKYTGNPFSDYLVHLSEKLDVPIIDNQINLPTCLGSGIVKNITIEEGLGVRLYHFSLNRELVFSMFSPDENEFTYKLIYKLEAEEPNTATEVSDKQILLYSNNFESKGVLHKNEAVCKIAIIFTSTWLKNNYLEASNKMGELIQILVAKNIPTIISEAFDGKSFCLAKQLAGELNQSTFPAIHIKMGCITLLNDFLNKIVDRDKQDVFSDQSLHYYTMIEVKNKLLKCLNSSLPCQEALAAEFNMSLSTLKRHFRIVFGKNIYEYYQEKRMQWGKSEIEKGHRNINEIAYQLGFLKVNNFSRAFKKQFDVLPRDLKHKSFLVSNF